MCKVYRITRGGTPYDIVEDLSECPLLIRNTEGLVVTRFVKDKVLTPEEIKTELETNNGR